MEILGFMVIISVVYLSSKVAQLARDSQKSLGILENLENKVEQIESVQDQLASDVGEAISNTSQVKLIDSDVLRKF